jgi:hypothetical protein
VKEPCLNKGKRGEKYKYKEEEEEGKSNNRTKMIQLKLLKRIIKAVKLNHS